MNLATIRQQVADHGFNDISTTEIDAAINNAYYEICGASNWPFLEEGPSSLTIGGTTRYGQLENLVGSNSSLFARSNSRILGVAFNNQELGALSPDDYFAGPHGLPAGSAVPTHYTVYANKLYVTPMVTGGVSVDVRFLKQPEALTADSSEPIFPSRYHQLIVFGAVSLLANEDDDDDLLKVNRDLLNGGIEQMKADLMVKTEGRVAPFGTQGSIQYWADRLRTAGFPKVTAAEASALLSDTLADVCSRYAWPFLRVETTINATANQRYINLPTDCVRPLGLYLKEKGSQIAYSNLADHNFDHHPSNTDSPGIPERYSLMPADPGTTSYPSRNTKIALWPVPDRAYALTLLYERRITLPNSFNSAIEWPGPASVLELGTAYRAALRDPSKETQARVAVLKGEYEQAIERMRNDFLIEQRDRDPVVRITQTDLWDY